MSESRLLTRPTDGALSAILQHSANAVSHDSISRSNVIRRASLTTQPLPYRDATGGGDDDA